MTDLDRIIADPDEFERLRDKLATGDLTAIEQMTFDNLLHDRLAALAGAAPVADAPPVPAALIGQCASKVWHAGWTAAQVVANNRTTPHAPAKAREDDNNG